MKDDKLNSLLDAFERFLGVVDTPPMFVTQATHQIDQCEAPTGTPSLADPDAEVYTVAELIARHEKGLMTNLNIGKDTAYPEFARLNDIDLEKAMNLEPTDRIHLANQMENDPEYQRIRKEEREKREAEEKAKQDADFEARYQERRAKEKDEEGKTKVVP